MYTLTLQCSHMDTVLCTHTHAYVYGQTLDTAIKTKQSICRSADSDPKYHKVIYLDSREFKYSEYSKTAWKVLTIYTLDPIYNHRKLHTYYIEDTPELQVLIKIVSS